MGGPTRLWVIVAILIIFLGSWLAFSQHRKHVACLARGHALIQRIERLQAEAEKRLPIGTSGSAVLAFFAENDIPAYKQSDEVDGTINVEGCSPLGCGLDTFQLGIRVKLDKYGSVASKPYVGGIYVDCL